VHAVSSRDQRESAPGVTWHRGDLLDPQAGRTLLEVVRPTHLLHLAWITTPSVYWEAPENVRWLASTTALLQAFIELGGERIVTAGTCAEYDWSYGYCIEGATLERPATLYGKSKRAMTELGGALAERTKTTFASGRVFLLYGPHEDERRLVSSVIVSLLAGRPALCTHGQQIRDLLHVQDVADAFVALLSSSVRGVVNIGSGAPVALRDVVTQIGDALGAPQLVQLGARPAPPGEPRLLLPDTSRLREEVGWAPRVDLAAGLADAIGYWSQKNR
jgi:nucleoside-diphosphate-sugar epimerase